MSTATAAPARPAAPAQAAPVAAAIPPGTSERVPLRATARHVGAIARRYLIQIKNDPEQLADVVLMPIIMLVLFVYVFGGAIAGSTHGYLQYIVPGLLVQTATMVGSTTGVGINTDLTTGVMDRFRALPIARSAVLTGRLLSDMARLLLCVAIAFTFATILGFRVHTNPAEALLAVLLVMAFAFALGWLFLLTGLKGRNPASVQGLSMLIVMPLQFGSSMFAPVDSMPGWLQAFVKVNPMTHITDACRVLLTGGRLGTHLVWSWAWVAGIILVAAPLAIRAYRKKV